MGISNSDQNSALLEEVLSFVDKSKGLVSTITMAGRVFVRQAVDGRIFEFESTELTEVLQRMDGDGSPFIQLNFVSGNKVIFTDSLVGFKPKQIPGLDMSRIPKVVTTPDLTSVIDALEDCLSSEATAPVEIDVLKRVFEAILHGGELAGFDMAQEKSYLHRLLPHKFKVSA